MKRLLLIMILLAGCQGSNDGQSSSAPVPTPAVPQVHRVYYVNSYHQGYPWSDGIERTIGEVLREYSRDQGSRIELEVYRMDSKRRSAPEQIAAAAQGALAEIHRIKPEVVIVSDDNAVKYLVEPYLVKEKIPVVFCGVNWSTERYHLPADLVTGMIEVQLADQIVKTLQGFARGSRVAFLKGDDYSARVEAEAIARTFKLDLDLHLVKNFKAWKEEYRRLQKEADLLILGNSTSIAGWNDQEALAWIEAETVIPSGGWDDWMARYCLLTLATSPQEQGDWAAHAALRILQGTPVADIPQVRNQKARIILNIALAKRMGIRFPMSLIDNATLLAE